MLRAPSKFTLLLLNSRSISTSANHCIDQKWREKRGLTANPNAFGPLTNLPDYTFLDGRPTPVGSNMHRRLVKQKETAGKIVTMCKELKFAKDRFIKTKEDQILQKQEAAAKRFKPKGHLLFKET